MSFDTPILILSWRRPTATKKLINALRPHKPSTLYLASDGPPVDCKLTADKVFATRTVLENDIDWPCQVFTLFRSHNLGCRRGVSEAISWFSITLRRALY